jgi:hypothetical protein
MTCVNCQGEDIEILLKDDRPMLKEEPDVQFIDIHYLCKVCGFLFNCVGSKSLNNSK